MRDPLRHVFDFRRQGLPVVVLLFLFFFLAIAVFQMLYPLKKGLFLENYGAGTELYAKLLNIVAAGVAVTAFTLLYNRLRRQHVVYGPRPLGPRWRCVGGPCVMMDLDREGDSPRAQPWCLCGAQSAHDTVEQKRSEMFGLWP